MVQGESRGDPGVRLGGGEGAVPESGGQTTGVWVPAATGVTEARIEPAKGACFR